MMFTTRRPPSRIDVYNYNTLLYRDYDTNINFTKSYFLSQSPPPMTYRDLRLVMANTIPSNIVILPEALNSSQILTKHSSIQNRRKHSSRKKHKRQGVDVYRSLVRADSRCSALSERDITNDEMMLLANSFVIDHTSPSPSSGFFHPQNLPNIQKHRTNHNSRIENSSTKSSYSSSPSLRIQHVGHKRPTASQSIYRATPPPQSMYRTTTPPLQTIHRTTPVDTQYEENNNQMTVTTTTTMISSSISEMQTRKQLHVYMPQILSC